MYICKGSPNELGSGIDNNFTKVTFDENGKTVIRETTGQHYVGGGHARYDTTYNNVEEDFPNKKEQAKFKKFKEQENNSSSLEEMKRGIEGGFYKF